MYVKKNPYALKACKVACKVVFDETMVRYENEREE